MSMSNFDNVCSILNSHNISTCELVCETTFADGYAYVPEPVLKAYLHALISK